MGHNICFYGETWKNYSYYSFFTWSTVPSNKCPRIVHKPYKEHCWDKTEQYLFKNFAGIWPIFFFTEKANGVFIREKTLLEEIWFLHCCDRNASVDNVDLDQTADFHFCHPSHLRSTLKGKTLIVSFKSRHHFGWASTSKAANRKSQKIVPI